MKTMPLGTIFPSIESLSQNDTHCDKQKLSAEHFGNNLNGTTKKVVKGEVRFYLNSAKYAVVSRELKVKWFEVRSNGDYAVQD